MPKAFLASRPPPVKHDPPVCRGHLGDADGSLSGLRKKRFSGDVRGPSTAVRVRVRVSSGSAQRKKERERAKRESGK